MRLVLATLVLAACSQSVEPVGVDPNEGANGDTAGGKADGDSTGHAIPDVQCAGTPDAGPAEDFDHWTSNLVVEAGDARHRGFDLVAPASAGEQRIEGWASYGTVDKALEKELVDLFACRAGAWQPIGTARTDGEGHFSLALAGGDRLPIGLRDLYLSIRGDRTGAKFLAYVAPDAAELFVSDVDGTLTSSENAFFETIALGIEPDARAGAADAYQLEAARGRQLVYVTARGNQYTEATRQWLADKGFPRGPVRLAPAGFLLPGSATVAYKTSTLTALNGGLVVAAGVGNRASDIDAYQASGVAADRIFIELPEYRDEVAPEVAAGRAVGFETYADLATLLTF